MDEVPTDFDELLEIFLIGLTARQHPHTPLSGSWCVLMSMHMHSLCIVYGEFGYVMIVNTPFWTFLVGTPLVRSLC